MSLAQFHVLLEIAHDHRLYPLLLPEGTAGLRRAEPISLRWADLDLASRTGLLTELPKLGRAGTSHTRLVAIGERAATALTCCGKGKPTSGSPAGRSTTTTATHSPTQPAVRAGPHTSQRAVRNLMRRAGIHHADLHSLRAFAMIHYPKLLSREDR